MVRLALTLALVLCTACAAAATAGARATAVAPQELWPGVTYERGVQFTPNGPVAISILRGPRPGGATTLAPVLSNDRLTGLETLTSMQRRLAPTATTAGVNGDFFSFRDGTPSGVLLQDNQVVHPPHGDRSSAGIAQDGTLEVRRVEFYGTWRGTGAKRVLHDLNRVPERNQIALYTPAWGASTPNVPGAVAAVLFPFPAAVPNTELVAPVVEVRRASSVPIPIGGAVLVARGAAAAKLLADAPPGGDVAVELLFRPSWTGIVDAIGGGPEIVRGGAPVFRANEAFTSSQLSPRAPRTAVGQLPDGGIVMVAVDGRQPGWSVGMTNFELAQALVRLGAVTGMAFDGGGSTAMAFEGRVLNRPSAGERTIATALLFRYTGVFVVPPPAVVSPNGDGVDDRAQLQVKLVRPSTTTVTLTAPSGAVAYTETRTRRAGRFALPFPPPPSPPPPPPPPTTPPPTTPPPTTPPPTPPPTTPPPTTPPPATTTPAPSSATVRTPAIAPQAPGEGRWTLEVSATDETGQATAMRRTFTVNSTLGFLRARSPLFVPPRGRDHAIVWRLFRAGHVTVTVETPDGTRLRTLVRRRFAAGKHTVAWNGLAQKRKPVRGGPYVVRVQVRNTIGTVELTKQVRVRRVVGPPAGRR